MASELYVETLKGLTSGANANKVIIPAGQTLDASAGTLTPSSGQIIQTVEGSKLSVNFSNSTTTYADSGISASITPTSTSSKILILAMYFQNARHNSGSSANTASSVALTDGDNNVIYEPYDTSSGQFSLYLNSGTTGGDKDIWANQNINTIDSPATTSSVTYKIRGKLDTGDYIRIRGGQIILMEIAG